LTNLTSPEYKIGTFQERLAFMRLLLGERAVSFADPMNEEILIRFLGFNAHHIHQAVDEQCASKMKKNPERFIVLLPMEEERAFPEPGHTLMREKLFGSYTFPSYITT